MSDTHTAASGPGLKRVLGLSSLVLYGIILIQPTAPMPLFGAAASLAQGHVVTTILIGMFAMLFTAISYGRMANAYPSAGSAYTYVSREIHPSLGYFVGWGMIFDYIMNPIICVIWISKAAINLIPEIPFGVYAVAFTCLFTAMNLRGIESSSRTNTIIATGLGVVIILFLAAAVRYLFLNPPANAAEWTRPFYDPKTFSFRSVSAGASLAVLTYIGFDGISTLSEEVHNPDETSCWHLFWFVLLRVYWHRYRYILPRWYGREQLSPIRTQPFAMLPAKQEVNGCSRLLIWPYWLLQLVQGQGLSLEQDGFYTVWEETMLSPESSLLK